MQLPRTELSLKKKKKFFHTMFFVNVSVNETERVRTVTRLICMHVKIYRTNLNHAALCVYLCVDVCVRESWKEGSEPFPPSLHFRGSGLGSISMATAGGGGGSAVLFVRKKCVTVLLVLCSSLHS